MQLREGNLIESSEEKIADTFKRMLPMLLNTIVSTENRAAFSKYVVNVDFSKDCQNVRHVTIV